LALDQGFDGLVDSLPREAGEAYRRLDLRWRDHGAGGHPSREIVIDAEAFQVLARDLLAHSLGRGGQLEMELETTAVGRIDLADRIGDPDGRHRILLECLVDPGLAVDRARAPLVAAEQAGKLLANGREDVLDFVEQ